MILRDQSHDIRIMRESRSGHLQVVGNDHIRILFFELLSGILEHVLRLHRESADVLAFVLSSAELNEDILRPLQLDRHVAVLLLDLVVVSDCRGIVAYCGSLEDHVSIIRLAHHSVVHALRVRDVDDLAERRRRDRGLSAYYRDVGTPEHRGSRQRIAHLAARVVRDEPDRIDRLSRRTGRDEDLLPCEVLLKSDLSHHIVQDDFGLRHLAFAAVAAREQTFSRLDDHVSVFLQYLYIVLSHLVFEHRSVHRGRYQLFRRAGEHRRSKHIVSQSMSQLCDHVRRRRSDDYEVGRLRQRDVLHIESAFSLERIHDAFVPREGLEYERSDELARVLRHYNMDVGFLFFQSACQSCRLVAGDAARDAEQYVFTFKHFSFSYSYHCHIFISFRSRSCSHELMTSLPHGLMPHDRFVFRFSFCRSFC